MKRFLEKRLKVYPSELPRLAWMAFIVFVIFFFTAIFRNYVDTAFLKRYGPENIPLMLVINSILTFIVFGAANRLGRRFLDFSLLASLLTFYALSCGGLFFMVKAEVELAYPILYQLLNLLDSILLVYLWNMAGDLFDARQGKRIFPLITAAQVLATALGNFSTRTLTRVIGEDPSLLVFGGACLIMAGFLAKTGGKRLAHAQPKEAGAKAPTKKITEIPGLIKEYPIVRFLIVVGLVPSLLLPIFNYQFSVIANNTFASEQSLITFLSYFRGGITLITFLILFVMGRLYSRIGLANASLIYPFNFALLFGMLTFFFNIYTASAGQFAVRLIQRAIHGPVSKILFNVMPTELVAWSRSFIRGTVIKVGMLAGALLMIGLKPLIDAQYLAPIAAVVALYWLAEALIFGRRYRRSLKQVIVERRVDFDLIESVRSVECEGHSVGPGGVAVEDRPDEIPTDVTCRLIDPDLALRQLEDSHNTTRAEAAASFAANQDPRAVKKLVQLLDDDEVVRKAAIDALTTYRQPIVPFLEAYLVEAPVRVQRGILEVIRLTGADEFDMLPFIGRQLVQAYTNLIALRQLEPLEDSPAVKMLNTHLTEKNDEVLSLVFQALWVKFADMRLMYEALKSRNASIAVEMIETSIDRSLVPYLIPLIEEIPLAEKIERGQKVLPLVRKESPERVLTLLASNEDETTRMLALLTIGQNRPGPFFLPIVDYLTEDKNPDVRQVANYAYKRCLNEVAAMPDIIEKINKLKAFVIFEGMGIRELQAIASIATLESFAPEEVIIKEGEDALAIYLIAKGKLAVYKDYGTDRQTEKAALGPGSFVGELSLFTKNPPNASCVAVDQLEAFVIRHHHFQEIMKIYPQIGVNMCGFLANKLRQTTY
ncbi:MAG: cyclic nucleotide-binding domain-containing protein [Deltaproteobacteria bacterium]|nr:cyclic nucleotide-binding domain-containing protein [Deltaproteobacteria bacterium]